MQNGKPKTIFLPVNMSFYEKVSDKIMGIIRKYVPVVVQTSSDEAYLDLTVLTAFPLHTNKRDSIYLWDECSGGITKGYEKVMDLFKKIKSKIK